MTKVAWVSGIPRGGAGGGGGGLVKLWGLDLKIKAEYPDWSQYTYFDSLLIKRNILHITYVRFWVLGLNWHKWLFIWV